MSFKMGFLTFQASLIFTQLKKAFIKALILYYFDLKCHIQIKINILDYVIAKVLSHLTFEISFMGQVSHKSNINQIFEIF